MSKLTQPQCALLKKAVAAESGLVEAAPDDERHLATLLRRGLVIVAPAEAGARRFMITSPGRSALGPEPAPVEAPTTPTPRTTPPPAIDAPLSKITRVVALLRRPGGATLSELMAETGWQAHSVRGALSGAIRKKLGLEVVSEKSGVGRVYRILDVAQ